MSTTSQINQLLLSLEDAALRLGGAGHGSVRVRLDLNCALEGAAGVVECDIKETHDSPGGLAVTLMPVSGHCVSCGLVFRMNEGSCDFHCPDCAPWPTQVERER